MLNYLKQLFTRKQKGVGEVKVPMKGTLSARVIRVDGTIEHYGNLATLN
jgi:hypothetical protein